MSKVCEYCENQYIAARSNQRFCSRQCRYLVTSRAWRARNPAKLKSAGMKDRAKNYTLTVLQLRLLLAEGCYAPGCGVLGDGKTGLHIDHDHACCPGKRSCGKCVRGALCRFHNLYLAYLEKDWLFALWAVRNPILAIGVRRES